jgi:ABC-type phosphate/phosphonate transport system substrate-binding protein
VEHYQGVKMIRRLITCCLIIVLLFTLAPAHASQEETTPVKIGVLAKRGAERCLEKWSPTAEYLTAMIPGRTFIIVPLDFKQIVFSVKNGDVDFVLANPSIYVELEKSSAGLTIMTYPVGKTSRAGPSWLLLNPLWAAGGQHGVK